MNEIAQVHPPQFHLTRWFWVGVATFVVGSGPLLVILLLASLGVTKDPNPNPIGPGIMAFLTFWPSVGVILWQVGISFFRYRSARKHFKSRVAEQALQTTPVTRSEI